jgi:hypothetical protein
MTTTTLEKTKVASAGEVEQMTEVITTTTTTTTTTSGNNIVSSYWLGGP